MLHRISSKIDRGVTLFALLGLLCMGPVSAAEPAKRAIPKFATIRDTVNRYFATQKDHQPLDFINRNDFDAVMKEVQKTGWTPDDLAKLRDRVLAPDSFIAKELNSAEGKAFQRQIGPLPLGYDRLDRLSKMQYGEIAVHRLIYTGKDGYKLIEYMTTSSGGKEMGVMLSRDPNGKSFNSPTGSIYTSEALLGDLQASYDAQTAKARLAPSTKPQATTVPQPTTPQRLPARY